MSLKHCHNQVAILLSVSDAQISIRNYERKNQLMSAILPFFTGLCTTLLFCIAPNETAGFSQAQAAMLFILDGKTLPERAPGVWSTGEISHSVTVLSKRKGTSLSLDNSRALANVLIEDVKWCVCVCVHLHANGVMLLFFRLG